MTGLHFLLAGFGLTVLANGAVLVYYNISVEDSVQEPSVEGSAPVLWPDQNLAGTLLISRV